MLVGAKHHAVSVRCRLHDVVAALHVMHIAMSGLIGLQEWAYAHAAAVMLFGQLMHTGALITLYNAPAMALAILGGLYVRGCIQVVAAGLRSTARAS